MYVAAAPGVVSLPKLASDCLPPALPQGGNGAAAAAAAAAAATTDARAPYAFMRPLHDVDDDDGVPGGTFYYLLQLPTISTRDRNFFLPTPWRV